MVLVIPGCRQRGCHQGVALVTKCAQQLLRSFVLLPSGPYCLQLRLPFGSLLSILAGGRFCYRSRAHIFLDDPSVDAPCAIVVPLAVIAMFPCHGVCNINTKCPSSRPSPGLLAWQQPGLGRGLQAYFQLFRKLYNRRGIALGSRQTVYHIHAS